MARMSMGKGSRTSKSTAATGNYGKGGGNGGGNSGVMKPKKGSDCAKKGSG